MSISFCCKNEVECECFECSNDNVYEQYLYEIDKSIETGNVNYIQDAIKAYKHDINEESIKLGNEIMMEILTEKMETLSHPNLNDIYHQNQKDRQIERERERDNKDIKRERDRDRERVRDRDRDRDKDKDKDKDKERERERYRYSYRDRYREEDEDEEEDEDDQEVRNKARKEEKRLIRDYSVLNQLD